MKSRWNVFCPALGTWVSRDDWRDRIITFDPSWFTVAMGTGIVVQNLTNFPWPAHWLRSLAYCFWILTIVQFVFFTFMSLLRLILYPKVAVQVLEDFNQTSYLGAIPIALDNIIAGIVIFYQNRQTAVWTAFGLYWAAVLLTAAVAFGGVFIMYYNQGEHKLESVTGVWLLSFIPMIVTAAAGSLIVPQVHGQASVAVLMVSFMMWSVGVGMCYIILGIYFWRLMKRQLPARDAIVSGFISVGPLGMGAFAIQKLAADLAAHIITADYTLDQPPQPQTIAAVAEVIHWAGTLTAVSLLSLGTFFLVEAFASVGAKIPSSFNIGFWGFVFPCGVYANALCVLGADLRNDGVKWYAAAFVALTTALWLGCTFGTVYRGFWKGQLFFAPGLQGWVERRQIEEEKRKREDGRGESGHHRSDESVASDGAAKDLEGGDYYYSTSRSPETDGTYTLAMSKKEGI